MSKQTSIDYPPSLQSLILNKLSLRTIIERKLYQNYSFMPYITERITLDNLWREDLLSIGSIIPFEFWLSLITHTRLYRFLWTFVDNYWYIEKPTTNRIEQFHELVPDSLERQRIVVMMIESLRTNIPLIVDDHEKDILSIFDIAGNYSVILGQEKVTAGDGCVFVLINHYHIRGKYYTFKNYYTTMNELIHGVYLHGSMMEKGKTIPINKRLPVRHVSSLRKLDKNTKNHLLGHTSKDYFSLPSMKDGLRITDSLLPTDSIIYDVVSFSGENRLYFFPSTDNPYYYTGDDMQVIIRYLAISQAYTSHTTLPIYN